MFVHLKDFNTIYVNANRIVVVFEGDIWGTATGLRDPLPHTPGPGEVNPSRIIFLSAEYPQNIPDDDQTYCVQKYFASNFSIVITMSNILKIAVSLFSPAIVRRPSMNSL